VTDWPSARPRQERRRRRGPLRRALPWLLRLVAVALVFAVGVALGRALDDAPPAGSTHTQVRTLKPLPLPPARETITVTVTR
jgi:hypothetical protein